ncbi:malate synthase family protein [Mycobacterium ulcerans str. Harvey]|uniref:Malate synthase family protein n=1 Tax=Mycobacterium ulcerans str. Harvey TaxID=1299332 RepID=A0ABN0QVS5_MYCUL|nr:malate synthase family protein [Mycobacterium ulcerans str. Harvey]
MLKTRDDLQAQIDKWHRHRVIEPLDPQAYREFLTEIGYLLPAPEDFTITTSGVDDEITTTAGPQLVVPILNARFALNAANARWARSTTPCTAPTSSPKATAPKRPGLQQGPW